MIPRIVIDRLLLESPLADAPQVDRDTLLIAKLGTEIVALTLHYFFDRATIVADSAIERYEICLPHSYILCSFALFFYPFLTLDSHSQSPPISCVFCRWKRSLEKGQLNGSCGRHQIRTAHTNGTDRVVPVITHPEQAKGWGGEFLAGTYQCFELALLGKEIRRESRT